MTPIPDNRSEEELRKAAYLAIIAFAGWNSGKNTPNILIQLSDHVAKSGDKIGDLSRTLEQSGKSADKLSRSLNWITAAAVLVAAVQAYPILLSVCLGK